MEYIEVTAKTVSEAITEACQQLSVTSDRLDYEVIDEGSNGFLGIGQRPAVIKAAVKEAVTSASEPEEKKPVPEKKPVSEKKPQTKKTVSEGSLEEKAETFLKEVFQAMQMDVSIDVTYDDADKSMDIDLSGDEMGLLIGKRGQTLDSLQYLVSLVVNKYSEDYVRVKVDTENYRQRRKEISNFLLS